MSSRPTKPPARKSRTPVAPAGPRSRVGIEHASRVDYLRSMIETAEHAAGEADAGTIAHVQLLRLSMDARNKLDEELDKTTPADPFAGLDEEEVREKLLDTFEGMPDPHLDIAMRVWCERNKQPYPIHVVAQAGG